MERAEADTVDGSADRRAELERRLRAYHDLALDDVLDAVAYLRDPGDAVLVGGSLAYGLGNHLSDLDVVIGGRSTRESSRVPLEHFVGTLRVDVWKLEQRLLEEVFDRAEEALGSDSSLHGSFGDVDHETDLKLLHRVAFGLTIDGPDPTAASPQRNYREIARDLVVREYLERLRSASLLARLTLGRDRLVAALWNAREAVEDALNAVIAARSIPFSGDKWLRERLAGEACDLAPSYAPFAQLPDPPAGSTAAVFVERALATAEQLTQLDLSFERLAAQAAWCPTELALGAVGGAHLLVSPQHGGIWELDAAEADTWRRLSAEAGRAAGAVLLTDCDVAQEALCLSLHERGLAELRWTCGVRIAATLARAVPA